MKSLLHYISEATVSTKYIDQLRTFIQDQRDNNPKLQIMFPELLRPWGTGTVHDLVEVGFLGSIPRLSFNDHTQPVIGVTKFEGKVYIIVKYLDKIDYGGNSDRVVEFDAPISDGYSKYNYTYILCDITDRYEDRLYNLCKRCTIFGTSGSNVRTKDPFKQNNEIYIRLASLHIRSVFDPRNDHGITEEEARKRFEAIQKSRVELYSIDFKLYKDLVDKSDNAPVKYVWGGDVDALYDMLLQRGKIVRELDAWMDELSTKVKWYAKNKVGLKTARLKSLSDDIDGFYKDLVILRDRIKNLDGGELEDDSLNSIYGFFTSFDRSLTTVCGKANYKTYTGVRLNRVDNYTLNNELTKLHTLIKKPFVEPADTPDDAPSFKMESECPTLIRLAELIYDTQKTSKIFSDYKKYISTPDYKAFTHTYR